ncbi:MAG: GNAT family N-acetyltransferase [Hyphomicrobiales bacterium]|nr:GNAT family N-acetyltransferase [Hyphomicrobiales bacterium]
MRIRDAQATDEAAWRELWAGYLAFYAADVPPATTVHTWARILDPAAPVFCRLAERGGAALGFSVCILHEGTWVTTPICYLEDLFVAEGARGAGLGRMLIDDAIAQGRAHGWSRLYWHTHADNAAARRLYDRFASADDFVRYRIALS